MKLPIFLSALTKFLLLLLSIFYTQPAISRAENNSTDLSSLLAFKAQIDGDPLGILTTSWTTNTSFCTWAGISCDRRMQRVTALSLNHSSLHGTISPHLANLSFLSYLNLANNTFSGPLPESIGQLSRLNKLNLYSNNLSGPIPSAIFNMSSLTLINLGSNSFSGSLPKNTTLPVISQLQLLNLKANKLTGEIPSFADHRLSLQVLQLSQNEFTGNIPAELSNLQQLRGLYISENKLITGTIPPSLGNLTQLILLNLEQNNLEGGIPQELGNLLNLQGIYLADNVLTGPIPTALLNASMLTTLELALNNLTGSVPSTIGYSLPLLMRLNMGANQLTGGIDFITSLSNCKSLEFLGIYINELEGVIPDSVGNLSQEIQYLYLEQNRLVGRMPAGLFNLSGLLYLDLAENELSGVIPSAVARLHRLQGLAVGGNRLTGSIPHELGLMLSLNALGLSPNMLSGLIPDSIGNLSGLQMLELGMNKLSSRIPQSIWNLNNLIELDLSYAALQGSLPLEVGNFKAIQKLDLSANQLSGNIPSALGKLQMLAYLDLSHNSFQGQIPESVGGLISINHLNLSHNFLMGVIPKSLANLRYLGSLDLSFNKLEGQIPEGRTFSNLSIPTLTGNAALCGAPRLGFPPCPSSVATPHSRKDLHLLKYVFAPIASALVLLACLYFLLKFRQKNQAKPPPADELPCFDNHRLITYYELVRATDRFSEANLLGRGSFGSVFKACLDDGLLAAVKVLNLEMEEASRSFDAECHALSMIRHRNLLKVISICSNLDFKALVLEFMVNGSLDKCLYSHDQYLNLLQRINIMVDVSSALEYLHHHHHHIVVHCDLKPSNVLLDENMVACVGDFGIAKLLLGDSTSAMSASMLGTIGYMAPEYGSTGKVSIKGDVYSFGILILETFTRKRPLDAMFSGEVSLREWVSKAYPATVLEVVDCDLLRDDYPNKQQSDVQTAIHACLSSIIELGLLCSRESPKERILMTDAVPRLQKIKMEYLSKLPKT